MDEIYSILENLRDKIKSNIKRTGVFASGKTSESLEVKKYSGGVKLVSNLSYFDVLEKGRKSGKMPPIEAIYQWTFDKGFTFDKDYKRKGFSFVVAKKIGDRGYGRPSRSDFGHETTDIYTDVAISMASIRAIIGASHWSMIAGPQPISASVQDSSRYGSINTDNFL